MSADVPLINGFRYGWSSIEVRAANGLPLINSLKEISYKTSIDRGELRGKGVEIIGVTQGETKYEGAITLHKGDFADLKIALGQKFAQTSFTITVSYDDESKVIVDTLLGCRMTGIDDSHSQGTDGLEVKLDLHIMRLLYDGVSPV